jgi:hypothetical protein
VAKVFLFKGKIMKKLSLIVGSVAIATSAFAHQVSGEFHDKSWNWNNGSHFGEMIKNGAGDNAVVNYTKTAHTHANGETHHHTDNMKEEHIATDKEMQQPLFDTGIKPSNSK